jgi:hypothetical protein
MAHRVQIEAEQLCRDNVRRQLLRAGNHHTRFDSIAPNGADTHQRGMTATILPRISGSTARYPDACVMACPISSFCVSADMSC